MTRCQIKISLPTPRHPSCMTAVHHFAVAWADDLHPAGSIARSWKRTRDAKLMSLASGLFQPAESRMQGPMESLFAALTDSTVLRIQRIRQPSRRHYQQSMLHFHLKLFLVECFANVFYYKNAGKIKKTLKT